MATSFFGNIRPATVEVGDVEIMYTYLPTRNSNPNSQVVNRLSPNQVLVPYKQNSLINGTEVLGGLYSLKLPKELFEELGIYTIYIRPKEIRTIITDCGDLTGINGVKGIIIDTTDSNFRSQTSRVNNGDYNGFIIEYLDSNNTRVPNLFRVVTSSNRCELVTENITNTTQKATKYRLNDSGNLMFFTLSPSSSSVDNPNFLPFLGQPNQQIIIRNTFFNPLTIEIQIVKNDADSLAVYIAGEQVKNVDTGKITYYNEEREIFDQVDAYVIKDEFGNDLYEVRERKEEIQDEDFDDITSGVIE